MHESSSYISDPAGREWGLWVLGDSNGPVILCHISSTILWIAIILRIFHCHDIACYASLILLNI